MERSTANRATGASRILWGLALLCAASASGCQVSVGGQTLPSPWYHKDDVQYYAPGPKFKILREAEALKEYAAEKALQ